MSNCPETGLPLGNQKPALPLPHFPTRWQAVLWRNWNLVTPARLARVLKTTESNVFDAAGAMGLGTGADINTEKLWLKRGYITLIRQNWHLLPYPQLLQLIDRTPEQMAYALKEDDFLWGKLGGFKPVVSPVAWAPLNSADRKKTAHLRAQVTKYFGKRVTPPLEKPFAFISNYGRLKPVKAAGAKPSPFKLNFVYSYSAVYGDPLLDPELDPYPDGLLSDLAANGVNGVWLQGVLYTLVPWLGETPCSKGHGERIANLNKLIEKAARHGIGVYLYLNEPRAMPPEFFAKHPKWRGSFMSHYNIHSMCISNPEVLKALRNGVSDLFRKAPSLGGVFTITMSENLTHCQSKAYGKDFPPCPRCVNRQKADMVAAVNNAIAEGAHAVRPEAEVIAWDWAWNPDWAANAVLELRPDIKMMCHSEAYLQTETGGIRGRVAEYAMSKIGPGFQAEELWQLAKSLGMERLAKIQMNNTWECSAVPYLPVPFLVKEHLRNLEKRGISGLMAGWTLGGYPGGNLLLTNMEPEELAKAQFGKAAGKVLKAWKIFGEAFEHFPTHGASMLYAGPVNYGPMNQLYAKPTGYRATMVGFPYDDLDQWRGILFPSDIFEEQFRILSEGWRNGLAVLRKADHGVPAKNREAFDDLFRVAEAAYCHFRSTYLQMKFIRLRDSSQSADRLRQIKKILDEEIELAKTLLVIVRRDSRIGFEASNHYYYTEQSLKEKVLNCEHVRAVLKAEKDKR
jgi:hypothetical protein